jgi:hypothetical protein
MASSFNSNRMFERVELSWHVIQQVFVDSKFRFYGIKLARMKKSNEDGFC